MPIIRKQVARRKKTVKKKLPRKKYAAKVAQLRRSVEDGTAVGFEPLGFDDDEGISINIYGKSGTGKTTLWGTFPGPIGVLLCSGSSRSGELRSLDTPENRKKIKYKRLTESLQIRDVVADEMRSPKFKTVVLEHATELQQLVLKEILGLDELPAQLSWGLATRQEWGQCALQMKELLRALLELPSNVVIVAQEREHNTDTDNELLMPYVASALTPSVVGWLNPACDYIVQTFIRAKTKQVTMRVGKKKTTRTVRDKGVEYCLRVGPSDVYTTKFRNPKGQGPQEEVMVDGDYDKIMKLIKRSY